MRHVFQTLRNRWATLIVFAMPIVGQAQVLYTYGLYNGSSTVQVNSINLSTGALTPVATTDAVSFALDDTAIDAVGHRLFFDGSPTFATRALYIVDLTNGGYSKLPGTFVQLEFDSGSRKLYTYGLYNGSPTVQVNSINLSTGALTPVATTDALDVVLTDAAVDPVGHRLFFVGSTGLSTSALYIVNLMTGSFSKVAGSFVQLEYDSGSGTLYTYGLYGGSTVQVASINLATGALTPVAITDAVTFSNTKAAIDPISHRLFFDGSPTFTTRALYTVSLTSGAYSKLPGTFVQLQFAPEVLAVPALSTFGLFLCVTGIALIAWFTRRPRPTLGLLCSRTSRHE